MDLRKSLKLVSISDNKRMRCCTRCTLIGITTFTRYLSRQLFRANLPSFAGNSSENTPSYIN